MASYAKQANDDTMRKMADRIQVRAIRRCGELLEQIEASKGGRPPKNTGERRPSLEGWIPGTGKAGDRPSLEGWIPGTTRTQAAADAGMSEHRRKTALRIASIAQPEFDRQVESESPPSKAALAKQGTATRPLVVDLGGIAPKDHIEATTAQAALGDVADAARKLDLDAVVRGTQPYEVADIRRDLKIARDWLARWLEKLEK